MISIRYKNSFKLRESFLLIPIIFKGETKTKVREQGEPGEGESNEKRISRTIFAETFFNI